MFDHIKANIFTIHGLLTTLIHVFLIVGAITSYIIVQTQVLGVDPFAPSRSATQGKR